MSLRTIAGRRYNELCFTNMLFTTICKDIYEGLVRMASVTGALNNHMCMEPLDDSSLRVSSSQH